MRGREEEEGKGRSGRKERREKSRRGERRGEEGGRRGGEQNGDHTHLLLLELLFQPLNLLLALVHVLLHGLDL